MVERQFLRDGVSHNAYGNAYLLEVAAAICDHPKDKFIQKDIADAAKLDKALVGSVLKKFVAAELITKLPKEGREQPYLRHVTVYWENARRHLAELDLPGD